MNSILWHYACGSVTADWLRECRRLEMAEDFAPLGVGPLEPESPSSDDEEGFIRAATEWSEEFPPDDITGQMVP